MTYHTRDAADVALWEPMPYIGAEPMKAYPDDAGWDLLVAEPRVVAPGQFGQIPLQTRLSAPAGHWLLVVGRSSAFYQRRLLVNPGVIDPSYTGPLFAVVFGLGAEPVSVQRGERLCQAIPIYNHGERIQPMAVDEFKPTARGDRGFGSSGR